MIWRIVKDMKALISVYEKLGIVELAVDLKAKGYELISTGGSAKAINSHEGVSAIEVSEVTGFSEMLDGRVKTLHPHIHGGILAKRNEPSHISSLAFQGISTIDLVAVNLYPFEKVAQDNPEDLDEIIENIDIGGPTLIRSAAKNYADVVILVDPEDYSWVVEKLPDKLSLEDRKHLASKAFNHVAFYDSVIAKYFSDTTSEFNDHLSLPYRKAKHLRYGENPHQQAALYSGIDFEKSSGGLGELIQYSGEELSYSNVLDADSAFRIVNDFEENTVAIIKHTNPCGLSSRPKQVEAYIGAYNGDPVSAYGGIVAFNKKVEKETAEEMKGVLFDVIIAPEYEDEALEIFKKRKRTRILAVNGFEENKTELRSIVGGILVQTTDSSEEKYDDWTIVSEKLPGKNQISDMEFAWKACKHVKSNSILLVKDKSIIGLGAGQPNRVNSVHLALRAAGDKAKDCVLASDAFFPFKDSIIMAAENGISTIIQPGGSIRDEEVIEAANDCNLTMVFTGVRHFKH